uniref:Trithorax group protein osa n=1 Tax=Macrostomum lignano TaxID=282301 RepID=A0A1I8H2E8_9PLAT
VTCRAISSSQLYQQQLVGARPRRHHLCRQGPPHLAGYHPHQRMPHGHGYPPPPPHSQTPPYGVQFRPGAQPGGPYYQGPPSQQQQQQQPPPHHSPSPYHSQFAGPPGYGPQPATPAGYAQQMPPASPHHLMLGSPAPHLQQPQTPQPHTPHTPQPLHHPPSTPAASNMEISGPGTPLDQQLMSHHLGDSSGAAAASHRTPPMDKSNQNPVLISLLQEDSTSCGTPVPAQQMPMQHHGQQQHRQMFPHGAPPPAYGQQQQAVYSRNPAAGQRALPPQPQMTSPQHQQQQQQLLDPAASSSSVGGAGVRAGNSGGAKKRASRVVQILPRRGRLRRQRQLLRLRRRQRLDPRLRRLRCRAGWGRQAAARPSIRSSSSSAAAWTARCSREQQQQSLRLTIPKTKLGPQDHQAQKNPESVYDFDPAKEEATKASGNNGRAMSAGLNPASAAGSAMPAAGPGAAIYGPPAAKKSRLHADKAKKSKKHRRLDASVDSAHLSTPSSSAGASPATPPTLRPPLQLPRRSSALKSYKIPRKNTASEDAASSALQQQQQQQPPPPPQQQPPPHPLPPRFQQAASFAPAGGIRQQLYQQRHPAYPAPRQHVQHHQHHQANLFEQFRQPQQQRQFITDPAGLHQHSKDTPDSPADGPASPSPGGGAGGSGAGVGGQAATHVADGLGVDLGDAVVEPKPVNLRWVAAAPPQPLSDEVRVVDVHDGLVQDAHYDLAVQRQVAVVPDIVRQLQLAELQEHRLQVLARGSLPARLLPKGYRASARSSTSWTLRRGPRCGHRQHHQISLRGIAHVAETLTPAAESSQV